LETKYQMVCVGMLKENRKNKPKKVKDPQIKEKVK
jgi:hypothetical protein